MEEYDLLVTCIFGTNEPEPQRGAPLGTSHCGKREAMTERMVSLPVHGRPEWDSADELLQP